MASMFLTVNPFVNKIDSRTFLNQRMQSTRRTSLQVRAVSKKLEPAKVVPQGDRVLIRLEELPEKSAGGVLLPKSAVKFERYLSGEILSTGADAGELGQGKKVLFSDISAYE
ncbi:10 kDa chaperonin 1, chloroplastic, partial [Cucurbita argyrosperma subsp. argyrosperma]